MQKENDLSRHIVASKANHLDAKIRLKNIWDDQSPTFALKIELKNEQKLLKDF